MASIGFRCPEEIAAQIQYRQELTGKSKSEVIIELITGLPSVGINDRKDLPTDEVVYFVWTAEKLLYIGQTNNLKQRLYNHHRLVEFLNDESRVSWFNAAQCDRLEIESELIELFNPSLNGEPCLNERLATFRIPHGKLVAFQEICSSNGMNLSSVLNKIVDGVISAGGFSWESKPSPDTVNIQNEIRKAIAPLVARIDALEKWINSAPEISIGKFREVAIAAEPVTDPNPGQNTPDPTPPVNESPKSIFEITGIVSEVAEVPSQKEQIPEIPEQKPDISESTISEAPDTIPKPTEFSGKSLDEILDSRGDAPEKPWFDKDGFDIVNEEHARYWDGQWVAWYTASACLDLSDPSDFQEVLDSGNLDGIVERIVLTDGDEIFRKIGETKTPVEETDD